MPQIERQYSGIRQVLLPHSSTIIIKLGTRPTILPLGSSVENKRPTRRRWWWSIGPHQLQEMEKNIGIYGYTYNHFLFAHFKKMIFLINPCHVLLFTLTIFTLFLSNHWNRYLGSTYSRCTLFIQFYDFSSPHLYLAISFTFHFSR